MPRGSVKLLCDEGAEAQPLVQLADEDQAAIGGDPQSLELDLQRGLERELIGAGIVLSPIGYAPPSVIVARKHASVKTFDASSRFSVRSQTGNPGSPSTSSVKTETGSRHQLSKGEAVLKPLFLLISC